MVINFFGRRGTGKTTTIRGNILYMKPPIIVVDVLGNFTADGKFGSAEYIQCINPAEAIEHVQRFHEPGRDKNKAGSFVVVLKTGDPAMAADYMSAAIWESNGGTLVLDEVDSIQYREDSCFNEYIRYGRNHGGDLITGCRRPAELDRGITAAANKFYCFQTHEPRDIIYFEEIFGERAAELMKLPKYSGMYIDYDADCQGTFHIDPQGNIYHDTSEAIS